MKSSLYTVAVIISLMMGSLLVDCASINKDWKHRKGHGQHSSHSNHSNHPNHSSGHNSNESGSTSNSSSASLNQQIYSTSPNSPKQNSSSRKGTNMNLLQKVLRNNQKWVRKNTAKDPQYFSKHKSGQNPPYVWIGCSDSRVPPNEILGLGIGDVFVLRNVAGLASPSDIAASAVIQYAVDHLKVTDVLVAGHYGCGGVNACLSNHDYGALDAYLSQLKKISFHHYKTISQIKSKTEQAKKMVELNAIEQVYNVASTPFVQRAWKAGRQFRIHGVVYDIATGKLIDLGVTLYRLDQLPSSLRIV